MLCKLCARCKRLTQQGNRYCQSCAELTEKQNNANKAERNRLYDTSKRNRQSAEFYKSMAWRKLRESKLLNEHNECEICRSRGKATRAAHVHHIVPIAEDWSKRLQYDNLLAVCQRHHNQIEGKTRKEIDLLMAGGR